MNRFLPALPLFSALPLVALLGCSSASDNGTIQIITDEEAGTFTTAPAPTELRILAESGDASTLLASAQLPAATIDLGQLSESASVVAIAVQGLDSTGTQRVFGASLPLQYSALAGQTVPIFVQRDEELARLPGPLSDARQAPVLALVQGEYLLLAGGADSMGGVAGGSNAATATTTQLFDFGLFDALDSPPTLPIAPQSIALSGTVAWLINDTGTEYFDFSTSGTAALPLPTGGTFSDVAGGATVIDSTGAQYIVGATRVTGPPTDKVLKVDPNDATNSNYPYGNTSWITLAAPRLGAAAAWVESYGLVVAGGSATAAGVEVVKPGTTAGSALTQFPSDPSTGAGGTALDGEHMLLAGGNIEFQNAGVREVDVGCASASCAAVPWGTLPVLLGTAQTFAWSATDALLVGNELGSNKTHVFRLTAKSVVEVPTRVPHVNARAAWSPVGSIVLFGGSNVLESFAP